MTSFYGVRVAAPLKGGDGMLFIVSCLAVVMTVDKDMILLVAGFITLLTAVFSFMSAFLEYKQTRQKKRKASAHNTRNKP